MILVLSLKLSSPLTQQFLTSLRSLLGKKYFRSRRAKAACKNRAKFDNWRNMYNYMHI